MQYYNGYQSCGSKDNNVTSGNSIDIKMADCRAAEIRADVLIETTGDCDCRVVRLWGQIKDCYGKPIPNALLKLVKVICTSAGTQYEGIAHTVSDCEGFYQFDLCYCDGTECYKVLVSKAYTEQEQVILTGGGNCHACEGDGGGYKPCKPYTPIITPASGKCGCATPQPPCPPCPPQPPCPPKPPCPAPCPPPQPPCPPPYPPCHCGKGGYQYSTGC